MAPGAGGKRKRGDRIYSGDGREDGSRPSPHRPDNLTLGQRSQQQSQQSQAYARGGYNDRGRVGRRGSRGGYNGSQRSPLQSPIAIPQHPRHSNTPSKPPSPKLSQPSAPLPTEPNTIATSRHPEQEQEKPKSAPYVYEYLTDERLDAWAETGRQDTVGTGVRIRQGKESLVLGNIFQEIIQAGVDGRLDARDAGSVIKEIIGNNGGSKDLPGQLTDDLGFDANSLFLDTLSVYAEASSPASTLTTIVQATEIPPSKIRRELDSTLLESLGLIRNTFVRVGIRQQTNLLYRQSNYNLLREETEGYSKLVTEFFTTSNNEPPTSEVVEETFERVKGMIGAFDLDVGRVLDITLDVFAAVLVKQYRFFVKYLRASSWWPQDSPTKDFATQHSLGPLPRWALPGFEGRTMTEDERDDATRARKERDTAFWKRSRQVGLAAFFEIGGRRADKGLLKGVVANAGSSDTPELDEDRKWIDITHTLPPPGNRVAAQVLGFKLRFYSSTARDASDVLPINLIYLAALLIKVGFITLRDLYPHIWPEDSAMDGVREEKIKEKAEKEKLSRPGGGATNALLAAAPLPDDTPEGQAREATRLRDAEVARRRQKTEATTDRSTPTVEPEEKAEELPEPAEQKVQLLKSLLCIGSLPEALYMLGRFPWLPDAFPDLPEYIHRILHHCLSNLYEPLRPLREEAGLREQQKMPDTDQAGIPKGQVKLTDMPARKTMRWAQLDKDDTNEAIDYRFYWDDWADIIPVCQDVDDVFTLCSTLLNYSGVKIGQDPTLLLKLSRIGSHSLLSDSSDTNMTRWIDLSKRLLVPALSLTKCNPGVVNEVFELIKNFPDSARYNIYAEWNFGQISRLPDIKSAFEQTRAETRDVLKRISKTTIKPMARALAKVTYASPGIVFSVAIGQLESYDNIVDTFVECARYFTYLAYDVLTWSLMSALGGHGRNRVQADGMLTSKWLAALSLFAGKVFKRYSVMNPLPIVQYVADQLRRGNPTDLLVLENITRSMAGIISDSSFNEAQVMAMGGGELLQSQTLLQLLDRRHESKTTARRLIKPLTESKLAGQVLVSLAQERQTCIFRVEDQDAHPKLLGNVFDQIHRVLGQYLDLLRSNLSVKDFDYFVPGVTQLITDFGVEPSVAFWICRPSINAAMTDYDTKYGKRNPDAKRPAVNGVDQAMDNASKASLESAPEVKDGATVGDDKIDVAQTPHGQTTIDANGDSEMRGAAEDVPLPAISQLPAPDIDQSPNPCHPILQAIGEAIRPALPQVMWDSLNPSFYTTFWQLSLGDVFTSLQPYDEATQRLNRRVEAINADRSDISVVGTQRKNREKQGILDTVARLHKEMKECMQLNYLGKARLRKEKDLWFAGSWGKFDNLNVALIEHCIFPRLVMSPLDAMYTFKMIKWLHSEGVANFRTMGVYDQLFMEKRLTSMIFLCSAKEAECLGRFLNDVLRDLSLWHADKAVFEREAYGAKKNLPGFSRKMTSEKEVAQFYDYEDFRRILLKWHRNLNNALKTCYASGEYMHIRNAINILNNVHQHFPAVNWMGSNQLASITELSRKEAREDLKIAATSLIGALKKREREWVLPQAFNLIEGGQAIVGGVRATSARPSTPQPGSDAAKPLNPKATEFKPGAQPNVHGHGTATKVMSGKLDAEDGEIEDIQMTDVAAESGANTIGLESVKSTADDRVNSAPAPTPSPDPPKPSTISTTMKDPALETSHEVPNTQPSTAPEMKLETQAQPAKPAPIPNRPENPSSSSSSLANGHHELPSRPESQPARRGDPRIPARSEDRLPLSQRDSRFPGRGGMDGPRDLPSNRGLERSMPPRSSQQMGDRLDRSGLDEGYGRPLARDARPLLHEDRAGRLPNGRPVPDHEQARRDFGSGTHSRDTGMAPPASTIPQHPDRAALIHGHPAYERDQRGRYPPDYPSHANSDRRSRGSSPTRADGHGPLYDDRRQPPDNRRPYDDRQGTTRYDDSHAPTGPRSDRPPLPAPNDRFRDSMRPPISAAPSLDPNHGRLRSESSNNRQSESYGRLNAGNDVPSGPRFQNGNSQGPPRGGRNISSQPLPSVDQQSTPASQNPASPQSARQAPSGPAMRSSARNQPPQPAASSSAPPTPSAQNPETAGIHPDRLKAIQGVAPRPNNTPPNRGGPRQPPSPTLAPPTAPPRGPNNQLPSPVGSSHSGRGPPTGPADRSRGDKRFTNLQNVLQQSNGTNGPERSTQGTSIRGRGGRANNVPSPSTSGPPTPSAPRQDPFTSRDDLFAGRPSGSAVAPPAEDEGRYGRGTRRGPPQDDPREPERRPGRHRSRSPGKDRLSDMRVREDERPLPREDPRDRFRNELSMNIRGNAGTDRRDAAPVSERELRDGPGPPRRGGRDEGLPREPERRDSQEYGRRGDDRERRDGNGSMRKRGRGGDDGFGERSMDGKRTRR
ncbi:MAG: hypothetical protein Q9217_002799 [Psora testacea]